jgi:hypothetical protein
VALGITGILPPFSPYKDGKFIESMGGGQGEECSLPFFSTDENCRASRQEKARGLICYKTDMWVELSLIHPAKRRTKTRIIMGPERLLVSNLLWAYAFQSLA